MRSEVVETNTRLDADVKNYALSALNADLVGVANVERFEHAPKAMSPRGLMPGAKSVVVMAITHLDGTIEVGGKVHPQKIGPYWVQYAMNTRLDEMSYRMALHLEGLGHAAVPIASSNIWRYNGFKGLSEQFAPDLSHMHAAVAAGLAEFGYNGLAITPEYGGRQRFVTIVTDAELTPSLLLEPGSVCDECMLCRKHCRSQALSKEIDGWNVVRIEDKEYRYAKKNLWRCAWGEHFDLDLDLELPDKVDASVILDNLHKHGKRGGEMGSCLRYCVPRDSRYFDKSYTDAPRRRKHATPIADVPVHRGVFEKTLSITNRYDLDFVWSVDAAKLVDKIDELHVLPDAKRVLICGFVMSQDLFGDPSVPQEMQHHMAEQGLCHFALAARGYETAYDMGRELQRNGFEALVLNQVIAKDLISEMNVRIPDGHWVLAFGVMTNADLPETEIRFPGASVVASSPESVMDRVERTCGKYDVTAHGAFSVERFDTIAEQVAANFDGREVLKGVDKAMAHVEVDPVVTSSTLKFLRPKDYLDDARSVLVLEMKMPRGAIEGCARFDGEAIGGYAFVTYESQRLLYYAATRVMKQLWDAGYAAIATSDLAGTGATIGNSRGPQADVFTNRFAAVAAGLGRLGKCGFVVGPEHGTGARRVAIVTNAVLPESTLRGDGLIEACEHCSKCVDSCPVEAFREEVSFELEGIKESFLRVDVNRCEWAKRHSFVPECGNQFMGWDFAVDLPAEISKNALAEAMRKTPPITKHHPCNFEICFMACPLTRTQESGDAPDRDSEGRSHHEKIGQLSQESA